MKARVLVGGFVALLISGGSLVAQTTRPAATAPSEMIQDKSARLAYGAEVYRNVNQNGEIVSVLRNGMTVITKKVDSPVMAVRGYIYTGGVYEGRWLGGGLSHLLEHLVAGGSSQRRTEAENRNVLQQIGNNSNAYTTYDHTAYFINTTPDHLDQAVDLLTGWLLGALITPEEYRREYQVVQRELEMGKGQPERQFSYLSSMNRYHVNPARVPVIGYQEVIQGLSRDDVYEYYKLAYQPNNMVLSIAGNLDPEVMLKAVQKYVNDAKPGREFQRALPAEPPVLAPRTVVATFPKLGRGILELAFPSIELSHPDLYALDLLASVLSDGESSLFTEELRDKKQLVYSVDVGSYTPEFADGSFEIQMRLDPKKIDAATAAVKELIESIKRDGIDPDRIARAKTQMRMAHVRQKQTAESIASSMATDYMSTGDVHFGDRYVERVEKVTPEQLQEVAKKYLDPQKLLTTAMLPAEFVGAKGLPKAEDLIRPVAPTTKDAPADVEKAAEVTRVELDNGVTLLLKRLTTSPLVVMNMYAVGGVTKEEASNNGIGNLTMEMLTRGTKTRSAEQIAEFFDSLGSEMNTACGNNSWFWNLSCLNTDLEKAMEVYADIVNNPSFPQDETESMKQRIIAAIDAQDAAWEGQAMRFFKQTYFGARNSPYQFQTIGKKEIVSSLKVGDLQKWYAEKVLKQRRVLAIYGDIDVEKTKALAAKFLGGGEKVDSNDIALDKRKLEPVESSGVAAIDITKVELNKTEQPLAGVVIGFDSDSVVGAPANYSLNVADTMMSGWGYPTGYLHEILRGRGLVYMVHGQMIPGRNEKLPGAFFVISGCEAKNVNEVIDTILENVARIQGSAADMQEGWFARSKQLITTSDAMDNETAAEQATTAALDELYGLGYNFHAQFADNINAVTLSDVRAAGKYLLSKCVITVSTPHPELVKAQVGRREYKSFPPVDLTPRGVQHDTGSDGTR